MKIIVLGASGMVGQGVLRECLLDEDVESVLSLGRSQLDHAYVKLQQIVRADVADLAEVEEQLRGYDACFFCLGISSAGVNEADYRRITHDLTLSVAQTLLKLNPTLTFIYVSGAGTDSTERGRSMWARVKGETENALLRLPFKAAYMFRPGLIQPLDGITSKTKLYRFLYATTGPLISLSKFLFPSHVTTTEQVGRAMLKATKWGAPKIVLESKDINAL